MLLAPFHVRVCWDRAMVSIIKFACRTKSYQQRYLARNRKKEVPEESNMWAVIDKGKLDSSAKLRHILQPRSLEF